ncbi:MULTISPECIES: hypothetical protein [Phaeobacter]|uniref:Uncharacterized protein n=1 Tax=Phaeobacter piscinae TaxID=1580596 RepID=A0ABM7DMY4_9RHOB|nr:MULTISPECIES: hypothetical protein [Phaeobacter]ATG37401.1 hypothetical protein PhaeoP36_03319 [Phaeobacter piscinae]AUQ87922.1 hypothetical protein PhaeoP42_03320 [Phaeobacter piscinae]AUR25805.1 hypothetical protein PhaeoP23_03319 [Phaeobacter piscinae]KII17338.1 hypothetical protein OO25_06170 [Phaeobacter sp. S60]UTS82344.1 hypothetical protein OL67_003450 [Phaeobacter piscinae]
MTGWKLFLHSVSMVQRNAPQLLQIFLVPGLIVVAIAYAMLAGVPNDAELEGLGPDPATVVEIILRIVGIWLAIGVICAWTAVSWHRYVLLEEHPQGWIPAFRAKEALWYFLRLLQLVVIGSVVYGVAMFVGIALISGMGMVGLAFLLVIATLIAVFMYRLVLILPAAALGKPIGVGESLELTTGAFGTLFVLALCLFGLQLLSELILYLLIDAVLISTVLQLIFSVGLAVLNISALTTLYGYYVEKRPI